MSSDDCRRQGWAVIAAAVFIGGFASGCAQPERWRVFDRSPLEDSPHHRPPSLAEQLAFDEQYQSVREGYTLPVENGVITLTVEEAVLSALANNRDLRVDRFSPQITATFEEIERGVYDPEFFARAALSEDEAVEISRATEENFSVIREDSDLEAGVRQDLPSGTSVELGATTGRSASNRSPEQRDVRIGLTLTQALLRGASPQANLARIRQAELDTVASLYELQGFTEAVLADTEATYWRYALATQRIRIFEESLELARRQQREVEQRIEIGVVGETEAAAVRAEVAQREQDLIDARSERDVLRLRLLRLINPEAAASGEDAIFDLDIVAATDPASEASPIDDLRERMLLAIARRPDLNEARLRLDQERLETIITRDGLLPRLDFFITIGKTGYAAAFSNAVRELDGETYDLTAGLELSLPIGNRRAEGFYRQSLLARRQAAEAVKNLEQIARLDVRLAAAEVERARQQIAATAATRALREEALRVESERFSVGESTGLLVAQAQRDLVESQINEVEALIGYRLALINLYLAEGALLARRGLTVDEAAEIGADPRD